METLGRSGLVGRAAELDTLGTALDGALEGVLGACFVEGEPGIGKTRLLAEVAVVAERLGAQVLRTEAEEYARARPFALLADLAGLRRPDPDERRRALAAAMSTDADTTGSQFQLIDGFVELFETMATRQPLVVLADDLQWADPSSLAVLEAMLRRLESLPVLLVGAHRPAPLGPELARLLDAGRRAQASHLRLVSLPDGDVTELVRRLAGGRPGPMLEQRVATCRGNPFLVTELLTALRSEAALEVAGDRAEVSDETLPTSLHQTILRRLAGLPSDEASLLRLAAVLGGSFPAADLAAATARSLVELSPLLDSLLASGLLVGDGGRLGFRHDIVRDVLYDSQPLSVRQGLHQEIARSLAAGGASAVSVAEHLSLGVDGPDAEVAEALRSAAQEAGRTAPGLAAELLQRALERLPPGHLARNGLVADLCEQLVWAGRSAEAEPLARDLATTGREPEIRRRALVSHLRALWMSGHWSELVEVADAAREQTDDEALRARLLAEAAIARLFLGDPEQRAERDARAALDVGERLGEEAVMFLACYALTAIHDFRGRLDEALAFGERSSLIARSTGDPDLLRYHPDFGLGMVLMRVDRHADSAAAFRRGMRTGEQLGTAWDLPLYHVGLAVNGYGTGRWDEAVADAEAALRLAGEVGTEMAKVAAHALLGTIACHRGDLAAAQRATDAAEEHIRRFGPQWGMSWLVAARALLQEASGDPAAAVETYSRFLEQPPPYIGLLMGLGTHPVRSALDAGRTEVASRITELVEAGGTVASARHAAVAVLCRGLVDRDLERLLDAVERFRAVPRPVETALACLDAAGVFAGEGQPDTAVALLEEATPAFQAVGAQWQLDRVEAALRALGVRRGRRGRRGRPKFGWDSLTPTEERVARLVAEGLTNTEVGARLFVSPRTVESHLSHAFNKLQMTSRVQLAAGVARREDAPTPHGAPA